MLDQSVVFKVICAVGLFFLMQLMFFWSKLENLDEKKLTIEAEIETVIRKRDNLQMKSWELQKDIHRMELRLQQIEQKVRDRLPLAESRRNLPMIYFITPTYYRPTQKADLTRLAQTLANVPNLYWIVVEDAETKSNTVAAILERTHLPCTHLNALTPASMKLNDTDPNWKLPRGVLQRNAALNWLRVNFGTLKRGVVYFGDDDNTYDWRLFDEMRFIDKLGVWPVGIVGGLLVETPILNEENQSVLSFNSIWKPERPFPIDMAAFAVNLSLLLEHHDAAFSYNVPRGYQESHFLTSLELTRSDLEPKANGCRNVLVWHTRTEKAKLINSEKNKFVWKDLSGLELDAVGVHTKMGERKGQNFYYPPDFDYKKHKSLNSYHGTHALRERAAKIKQGILIIRFEMPFNIWCLGCNNHVGMGVRYNAEKKKVGMYYTTPLYEFRMKCHLCDNYFVIRTDPEHFDYELVEGCRRQEKRYDPSTINQLGAVDRTFNRQLEGDKMFKVEHEEKDKTKGIESGNQMETLEWIQERMRDDFAANQALRRKFRHEKQQLKDQRVVDDDLLRRSSLNMKLLPESDEDKTIASAISKCRNISSYEQQQNEIRSSINNRSIFKASPSNSKSSVINAKLISPKKTLSECLKRKQLSDAFDSGSSSSCAQAKSSLTRTDIGVKLNTPKNNSTSRTQQTIVKDETNIPCKVEIEKEVERNSSEGVMRKQQTLTDQSMHAKKECSKTVDYVACNKSNLSLVADYDSSNSSDNDASSLK
ncbi:unnamed protein product [Anisakis simplex]|uniref:Galactosylgalactosylxylosylprotein 3-beta-glucuronosyltransferase n=1 Tax=Anisakis simplex TaxID=6269 RepID=A0A0M3JU95_ANISI|nr:unnamed protein product [Anisakis simplex]